MGNDEVRKMLDEELKNDFDHLNCLPYECQERSEAVDDIVKFYKLKLEEDKRDAELNERSEGKIVQGIKFGLELTGIVLPLIFYGVWMRNGFKFEEKGVFSSPTFKGLIQKFKPTR